MIINMDDLHHIYIAYGNICLQLPSDSTSRWTPLSLANSSYCKGL
ncbi:hypothetical protein [Aerococcus tenax]